MACGTPPGLSAAAWPSSTRSAGRPAWHLPGTGTSRPCPEGNKTLLARFADTQRLLAQACGSAHPRKTHIPGQGTLFTALCRHAVSQVWSILDKRSIHPHGSRLRHAQDRGQHHACTTTYGVNIHPTAGIPKTRIQVWPGRPSSCVMAPCKHLLAPSQACRGRAAGART